MEEQIIRNIHENKENRPDSLEIGTPGKGGAVKITFNASHSAAETATLIDNAFEARAYAKKLHALQEVTP
jgi:hypothetical protein